MIQRTAHIYRNAFSGLSKETWLLSFIMLVNRSGTMVVPFMTLYITSLGYSLTQAGIVFGLFGAGAFSGAWLGGRLTDKLGFYQVQVATLFLGGLLFFVLGQMKSYPMICLFTFLLSFVNEAFRPANSTAIAAYSREDNRTRSYTLNRLAINIGWAIGSATGGVLAHVNFELLFWVDGATNIFAALLLVILLREKNQAIRKAAVPVEKKSRSAWEDRNYMLFILVTILFAGCFFQLFTNLSAFLERDLHFSKPYIGLLMGANGVIIALLEMVLINRLEKNNRPLRYIMLGIALVGLSFLSLTLPLYAPLVGWIMIVTVTIGEILALPFMNSFWIKRAQPDNRGQYAAVYTMAWSAAQTLGPMAAARLADEAGFFILWWCVGGACLLAAYAFYRFEKAAF